MCPYLLGEFFGSSKCRVNVQEAYEERMYLLTNYKNTHKNIVMTHCYKKCNNNQTWICHFWQTPNPHFSNKPDARYRYKHWTKKWSSWSKWTGRMWTSERVKNCTRLKIRVELKPFLDMYVKNICTIEKSCIHLWLH